MAIAPPVVTRTRDGASSSPPLTPIVMSTDEEDDWDVVCPPLEGERVTWRRWFVSFFHS